MAFVDELLNKAKAAGKTIVLCEGEDKRVVEAASKITKEGIAKIILIGSDEDIKASGSNADLSGVTIVDPAKDANADKYPQGSHNVRRTHFESWRRRRICKRRMPLYSKHIAPRLAGYQNSSWI